MKFWSSNKCRTIIEKRRKTFLHSMTFDWKNSIDDKYKTLTAREETEIMTAYQ